MTVFIEVLGDREGSLEAAPYLLRFINGLWGVHQSKEIMCKIYVCVFFRKLGFHQLSQGVLGLREVMSTGVAGDFRRACHGGRLWPSQFIGTSAVPGLCYQLCRIPLSHDIVAAVPLFSLPFGRSLWYTSDPSLIFHFSGWQWKKSISGTDRTV